MSCKRSQPFDLPPYGRRSQAEHAIGPFLEVFECLCLREKPEGDRPPKSPERRNRGQIGRPVIIDGTHQCNRSPEIQNLRLDSNKRRIFLGVLFQKKQDASALWGDVSSQPERWPLVCFVQERLKGLSPGRCEVNSRPLRSRTSQPADRNRSQIAAPEGAAYAVAPFSPVKTPPGETPPRSAQGMHVDLPAGKEHFASGRQLELTCTVGHGKRFCPKYSASWTANSPARWS